MNADINISSEEWEPIERYLQGKMDPAERQSFEEKITADNELQAKVKEVQLLMLGVQEAMLSAKLNRFHQEMPTVEKTATKEVKLFSAKRWLAAASVVFLIVVSCWFFLFKKTKNENLYATYFSPDPGLITAMSTTDNYVFDRAMVDYKTGKYATAINAWKGLLQTAPQNDTLNYFIGTASLAGNHVKEAIPYLQKVTTQPQSFFLPDAYWYLGLALLKEGKKEEAIAAIRQSSHPQKEALLQALK